MWNKYKQLKYIPNSLLLEELAENWVKLSHGSTRYDRYSNRLDSEVTPSFIFVKNWNKKAKLLGFEPEQGTPCLIQQPDVPTVF